MIYYSDSSSSLKKNNNKIKIKQTLRGFKVMVRVFLWKGELFSGKGELFFRNVKCKDYVSASCSLVIVCTQASSQVAETTHLRLICIRPENEVTFIVDKKKPKKSDY